MTNSEKLRALADWFDLFDKKNPNTQITGREVQIDLRAMATEFEQLQQHSVMQVPQFEEILQVRLEELPYTKHLDDGQYNDGQVAGFEYGARWLYEKLSSGTTVGKEGGDASVSDGK
jgi:hypothetical protein